MISTRPARALGALAAIAATAAALAGCSTPAAEPAASGSAESVETLTVAIGAAGTYAAPLFLAGTLGYAKEEGLDLQITTVGTNVLNVVLAGQADMGMGGVGQSLPPIEQGKGTKIVYALESGAVSATVVGTADVATMDDCTSVITSPLGSSAYSATGAYLAASDSDAPVTAVPTVQALLPSLLSGEHDCTVNATSSFVGGMTDGLHVIVDPQDESTMPTTLPLESTGIVLWGVGTHLDESRSKVEKLMRALVHVEEYLADASPEDVAASLADDVNLAAFTPDDLVTAYQGDQPFLVPNGGLIDEDTWANNLELYSYSFPQIAQGDPMWDYENVVDMSFLEAAE